MSTDHDEIRRDLDRRVEALTLGRPHQRQAVETLVEQLDRWSGEHFAYHVALVIDNEQDSYNRRREMAATALDTRHQCPVCDGTTRVGPTDPAHPNGRDTCSHCDGEGEVGYPYSDLADALKDWVESMIYPDPALDTSPDDLAQSMLRELLGSAVSATDWHSLGRRYIDEEKEARANAEV